MLKVLIADDERIVRKTLRLIGNWDEYEMEIVGEAQNGMEALEMIDQLKPDILLLDMKMPGLSGNQILEQLTGDRKRIHVIVISGYDDFEYARMALKYGAIDYLLKPINRNEFNQALHRIYENEQKMQNVKRMLWNRLKIKLILITWRIFLLQIWQKHIL